MGLPSCRMADEFMLSRMMFIGTFILPFRITVCAHLKIRALKHIYVFLILALKKKKKRNKFSDICIALVVEFHHGSAVNLTCLKCFFSKAFSCPMSCCSNQLERHRSLGEETWRSSCSIYRQQWKKK